MSLVTRVRCWGIAGCEGTEAKPYSPAIPPKEACTGTQGRQWVSPVLAQGGLASCQLAQVLLVGLSFVNGARAIIVHSGHLLTACPGHNSGVFCGHPEGNGNADQST